MIKGIRSLTILLGKLGFKQFRSDHSHYVKSAIVRPRPPAGYQTFYGLGLKESKDLTERILSRKATKDGNVL
jgi:hypothetical protein